VAKLSNAQWADIRKQYEVDKVSTVQLAKSFGVADTTIQRRLKRERWCREKTQDAIEKKVSAIKALADATQDNAGITQAINIEADRRLRLEGLFADSLEYNQKLANKTLKNLADGAELQDLNIHSQITNRNKDGIMGKMPQTQVNIQNNQSVSTDSMSEAQLREELKARGLPPIILDE